MYYRKLLLQGLAIILTSGNLARVGKAFRRFDADSSGHLDADECKNMPLANTGSSGRVSVGSYKPPNSRIPLTEMGAKKVPPPPPTLETPHMGHTLPGET